MKRMSKGGILTVIIKLTNCIKIYTRNIQQIFVINFLKTTGLNLIRPATQRVFRYMEFTFIILKVQIPHHWM